jgi:hypothetical protein
MVKATHSILSNHLPCLGHDRCGRCWGLSSPRRGPVGLKVVNHGVDRITMERICFSSQDKYPVAAHKPSVPVLWDWKRTARSPLLCLGSDDAISLIITQHSVAIGPVATGILYAYLDHSNERTHIDW